jgi:RimJ/RimL family protein N-acetyltransferase
MRIELASCSLRSWRASDAEPLARFANDRSVWRNLRDAFPHPYSLENARAFLERTVGAEPETNLAIAVEDGAVGGIGFTLQEDVARRSAEIGFWLGAPYRDRGIATAAVRALAEHAFAAHDLLRIYAQVFEWNGASLRVLERAGFQREGVLRRAAVKDGAVIDVFLYARLRG